MASRVTPGTIGIGIIAILAGLVGAYALRSALSRTVAEATRVAPESFSVPLASNDLPKGRIVAKGDIGMVQLTRKEFDEFDLPYTVIMMSADQIIGRRLREATNQGDPFLTTSMYLEGEGPSIAELLKPGFRAAAIQVPNERGGTVESGDIVDVLFRSGGGRLDSYQRNRQQNLRLDTGRPQDIPEISITLLQGVEVIAVSRPSVTALQASTGYVSADPTITLAVTPEQASKIQVVQGHGELSLATRAANDSLGFDASAEGLTLEELLGIEPPPPPPPPVLPFQTEIYLRGSRSINTFEGDRLLASAGGAGVASGSPGSKPAGSGRKAPGMPGSKPAQ